MSEVGYKVAELLGGPLDGERVRLRSFISEFQKARTVGSYYIYRETECKTKDGGANFFWYVGVGGNGGKQ